MFGGIFLLDLTWIVFLIFVARKYFLYLFVKKLCAGVCCVLSSITEASTNNYTIVLIIMLFNYDNNYDNNEYIIMKTHKI